MEKESDKSDIILDYYKDWDSSNTPVMFEKSNDYSENLEAQNSKNKNVFII